jgi:hypothetical protein
VISKRFFGTISLAVVMGKDFGYFGEPVAAPTFDFLNEPV